MCVAGAYAPNTNMSVCTLCPAGFYDPAPVDSLRILAASVCMGPLGSIGYCLSLCSLAVVEP